MTTNITPAVKKFIEQHIDLIEDNNFSQLYFTVSKELSYSDYPLVTKVLVEAGIDPLVGMIYVPANYMHGLSDITRVIIPETVISIHRDAFSNMPDLNSVQMPKSVVKFAENIFDGSPNLHNIAYEGTKEDWKHIQRSHHWRYGASVNQIHCSDGLVKVTPLNKQN